MRGSGLLGFPDPVNDKAARTVAAGVVVLSVAFAATGVGWLLVPLAFGFWARVLTGPRLSPLGRFATEVAAPRLGPAKLVPGPPKRFAQGIGVLFSTTAVVLWFAVGAHGAARVVVGLLAAAASLEAAAGLCLGCIAFRWLMRAGVISADACPECADVTLRHPGLRSAAAAEPAGR